jgi:hypothetical protein
MSDVSLSRKYEVRNTERGMWDLGCAIEADL